MKEIKNYFEENTNDFYDINNAANGGGYYQPLITFDYGKNHYRIEDTSCGDFGNRFAIKVNGQSVAFYDDMDKNYWINAPKNIIDEFCELRNSQHVGWYFREILYMEGN